jgi:hypothetical protein
MDISAFLSGSPLLDFTVDGSDVGATVAVHGGTVQARGSLIGIFPTHSLQLVHKGWVVATAEDPDGPRRLNLGVPFDGEALEALRRRDRERADRLITGRPYRPILELCWGSA